VVARFAGDVLEQIEVDAFVEPHPDSTLEPGVPVLDRLDVRFDPRLDSSRASRTAVISGFSPASTMPLGSCQRR